jgi:5''-nucleotidase/2'',3''-cyclic phosphodiesterase and related esterases
MPINGRMEDKMRAYQQINNVKKILSAILVFAMVLALTITPDNIAYSAAKTQANGISIPENQIEINLSHVTLYVDGMQNQAQTALEVSLSSNDPSINTLFFKSSDPKIAIVSPKGIITAKAAGTAQITAAIDKGFLNKAVVTVTVKSLAGGDPNLLNREQAAVLLVNAFQLAKIIPEDINGYENAPKDLGLTPSSEALSPYNIIAAAKDCVDNDNQSYIESAINAHIIGLASDERSFGPTKIMSEKEFATCIAKAFYGPDKKINYLSQAYKDGILTYPVRNEDITIGLAKELLNFTDENDFQVLSVYATSDIQGNMLPVYSADAKFKLGSVSRVAAILKEARSSLGDNNVLYVDGGDLHYHTTLADITKGIASVAVFNQLGLDATVLGSHDFDFGIDNILKLANYANYSMLSSNTYYDYGAYPEQLKPYTILHKSGLKIGILGITDDDSASMTLSSNTKGISFYNDIATAEKIVKRLKKEENCDLVIALSHLHSKNAELLNSVNGIDLCIGGGNDTAGRPQIINHSMLINPGTASEVLNQINLNLYKGKLIGINYNEIILTERYREDNTVNDIITEYQRKADLNMTNIVGYLPSGGVQWASSLVCMQSAAIGNLVTDAVLDYTTAYGSQIALVNGGSIQAGLPGEAVALRNIYDVLPNNDELLVVEMSGQTLWDALENGVSSYSDNNGKFLQVAGITYSFDLSQPVGLRIQNIQLPNGDYVNKGLTYKVVINRYLANASDGYTMLNLLNPGYNKASNIRIIARLSNDSMRDALLQYIEKYQDPANPLIPNGECRITIYN